MDIVKFLIISYCINALSCLCHALYSHTIGCCRLDVDIVLLLPLKIKIARHYLMISELILIELYCIYSQYKLISDISYGKRTTERTGGWVRPDILWHPVLLQLVAMGAQCGAAVVQRMQTVFILMDSDRSIDGHGANLNNHTFELCFL